MVWYPTNFANKSKSAEFVPLPVYSTVFHPSFGVMSKTMSVTPPKNAGALLPTDGSPLAAWGRASLPSPAQVCHGGSGSPLRVFRNNTRIMCAYRVSTYCFFTSISCDNIYILYICIHKREYIPVCKMYGIFSLDVPVNSRVIMSFYTYGHTCQHHLSSFYMFWILSKSKNRTMQTQVCRCACWTVRPELAGYNLSCQIVNTRIFIHPELQWHLLPKMQPNKACHSCRIKPPLITAPSHPCSRQAWNIASATKQPKAFSLLRSSWVRVDKADPIVHNTSWRVQDSALVSTLVCISLAFIQYRIRYASLVCNYHH